MYWGRPSPRSMRSCSLACAMSRATIIVPVSERRVLCAEALTCEKRQAIISKRRRSAAPSFPRPTLPNRVFGQLATNLVHRFVQIHLDHVAACIESLFCDLGQVLEGGGAKRETWVSRITIVQIVK